MMKAVALAALAATASAHGGLTFPPSRNNYGNQDPTVRKDPDGQGTKTFHNNGAFCTGDQCLWFNEGCWVGCPTNCSSKMPANNPKAKGYEKSPEFTWNTYGEPNCEGWKPMEPTLPEKYRTWNIGNPSSMGDFTKYHPWRAPGRSPTVDPCGMGGAYLSPDEGGIAPQGSKLFARGSELPVGVRTEWKKGSVEEAAFMLGSNHGGGYLYSLCPANETLTEACFHRQSLPFVGSMHTIRYLDNRTIGAQKEVEFQIPAVDVNVGTWPAGSTWRVNPIPACNCDRGDSCQNRTVNGSDLTKAYADDGPPNPKGEIEGRSGNDCPTGTQFPVPFPYGYGQHLWYNLEDGPSRDMWAIVDQVQVPNITGDFVLRWRWVSSLRFPSCCCAIRSQFRQGAQHPGPTVSRRFRAISDLALNLPLQDTEQNPQIWTHCADVRIV